MKFNINNKVRMGATAPFETEIEFIIEPRNLSEAVQILAVEE